MKRVIAALLIMAVVAGVAFLHVHKAKSLADAISSTAEEVIEEYGRKNRDSVLEKIGRIEEMWNKNQMWAHSAMSTKQIDEIEVSLTQSRAYCEAEAWDDFAGEFAMFCMLIEHLAKQESFSLGELL